MPPSLRSFVTVMVIRVVLADDEPMVRTGLSLLLGSAGGITVVDEVGDGESAVRAVARWRPDVALLDVRMPGGGGIEATRRIRDGSPADDGPQVILLSTADVDDAVFEAARSGAAGLLFKHAEGTELVAAVRSVAAGEGWLDPAVVRRILDALPRPAARPPLGGHLRSHPDRPTTTDRLHDLTPREHEVLVLLAEGRSNQELAAHLVLAEATVKNHVSRILAKLGLRDRAQATALAHRCGLLPANR